MSTARFRIALSILSADFLHLEREVRTVQEAGADLIHIDVMDGHFVDNITMGPLVVEAVKRIATVPLDVHLMITDPLRYLGPFVDAGADHVTFHVEADSPSDRCIHYLRERGVGVGVSIRPDTAVGLALDLLTEVDMILVMTVYPGFGGQAFMPEPLKKIPPLREAELAARHAGRLSRALDIQVDGGIGPKTIRQAADAGANVFVAGNSVFGEPDPRAAVLALRECLEELTR